MKIRLTQVIVKEYEPDPGHYPVGLSVNEMAEIDRENYDAEPGLLMEYADSIVTTAEFIDDEGNPSMLTARGEGNG